MSTGADIAAVAALVGDPARANILAELMNGRALAAGELARVAGVVPSTASEHLAKLADAGLLTRIRQGRARYYRLASADVAVMLEAILALSAAPLSSRPRAVPRVPPELKVARTCYDHIAGELGVAIADALIAQRAIEVGADGGRVTNAGLQLLARFGLHGTQKGRRPYCRICLDWSERRPHISGALGAQILNRSLELGWVTRPSGGRALAITPSGHAGYRDWLEVRV